MDMKFDIFMKLPDGKPLWLEAVEGYEKAKRQMEKLTRITPGEYFLFDSRTGQVIRD